MLLRFTVSVLAGDGGKSNVVSLTGAMPVTVVGRSEDLVAEAERCHDTGNDDQGRPQCHGP